MNLKMNLRTGAPVLLLAALLAFGGAAPAARSAEDSFGRLVARWKVEREQIVKRITQAWLRGDAPESQRGDLMRLSQIESGLATQPGTFLYIGAIENANDLAGSVTAVARAWLKQRGVAVDSAEFLRGKTFYVLEDRPAPKATAAKAGAPPAGGLGTAWGPVSDKEGDVDGETVIETETLVNRAAPGTRPAN